MECTPACQAGGRGFKSRQVRGRIAQSVERAPEKREVTGSTPVPTTEKGPGYRAFLAVRGPVGASPTGRRATPVPHRSENDLRCAACPAVIVVACGRPDGTLGACRKRRGMSALSASSSSEIVFPAALCFCLRKSGNLRLAELHLSDQVPHEFRVEGFFRWGWLLRLWSRGRSAAIHTGPEVFLGDGQLVPEDGGNELWIVDLAGSVRQASRKDLSGGQGQVVPVVAPGLARAPRRTLLGPVFGLHEPSVGRMGKGSHSSPKTTRRSSSRSPANMSTRLTKPALVLWLGANRSSVTQVSA